ncbi:MAG: hypothetical protein WC222_06095 [Parachlamydiales bacterium]
MIQCENRWFQRESVIKNLGKAVILTGLTSVSAGGFYLSAVPIAAGAIAAFVGYRLYHKKDFPEDTSVQIRLAQNNLRALFTQSYNDLHCISVQIKLHGEPVALAYLQHNSNLTFSDILHTLQDDENYSENYRQQLRVRLRETFNCKNALIASKIGLEVHLLAKYFSDDNFADFYEFMSQCKVDKIREGLLTTIDKGRLQKACVKALGFIAPKYSYDWNEIVCKLLEWGIFEEDSDVYQDLIFYLTHLGLESRIANLSYQVKEILRLIMLYMPKNLRERDRNKYLNERFENMGYHERNDELESLKKDLAKYKDCSLRLFNMH